MWPSQGSVVDWCECNHLRINASKTKEIVITRDVANLLKVCGMWFFWGYQLHIEILNVELIYIKRLCKQRILE